MRKFFGSVCLVISFTIPTARMDAAPDAGLYAGWLQMYDLKFDDAHRSFAAWKQSYPDDSRGPASNAAAYLFSELARLGALESELFVDDSRFKGRPKLRPDPAKQRPKNNFTFGARWCSSILAEHVSGEWRAG